MNKFQEENISFQKKLKKSQAILLQGLFS